MLVYNHLILERDKVYKKMHKWIKRSNSALLLEECNKTMHEAQCLVNYYEGQIDAYNHSIRIINNQEVKQ